MNLIKNNEINISKRKWRKLNKRYDKETIKKKLSNAIDKYNLEIPYAEISLDDAKKDFIKLRNLPLENSLLKTPWFTRYKYNKKYYFKNKVFKSLRLGNISSNYFHQKARYKCGSKNSPSPYRSWHTEKFRLTMFNALWSLKYVEVNPIHLRKIMSMRMYVASQFRPATAKAIYEYFNAKHILDFCSGWGDRLQGFLASDAKSYTGIDPNTKLVKGYAKQIKVFGKHKTVNMICGRAEKTILKRKFDFVFTSPPYFNAEHYTEEDTQSFKQYPNLDDWLNKFLFRSIKNAWKALKSGGHLAINISDIHYGDKVQKICDPMNKFISKLDGAKYRGCYGYVMNKRVNSGALKEKVGVFAEPIWVWKKL